MKLSLKEVLNVLLVAAVLLATATVAAVFMSQQSADAVHETGLARYRSYLLADEMRQSSGDLTRLARSYVVTGDPKWEKQYLEIIAIRNGELPRPQAYERIYWDFRAAGAADTLRPGTEKAALLDLMKRAGFSQAELDKLEQAKANSDALVRTETIAMNMVKGLYDDGKGGFTRRGEPDLEKARIMMHDLAYHQNKAKIMKPVDEFFELLDQRTSLAVATAVQREQLWSNIAIGCAVLFAAAVVLAVMLLSRKTRHLIDEAGAAASAIAEGNLTRRISVEFAGDELRLMQSMDQMRQKLAAMVSSIREVADGVATGSREIATGNLDLSGRTESQASALEQAAATMDQLSSIVRRNAENAQQADELARGASTVATRGGSVVGEVVQTMRSIDQSSKKISEIISVVDGIAFQTNILALNAAVEAARAGEQGRGFAVVAGEVRSLAQRSAEAAKEVKELITASVDGVERGTALADQAGKTMEEMVAAIGRVTTIMSEISSANLEQSTSIEQVGQAVSQMDQATQQNAALVEQSAAAASSLKAQAEALLRAVNEFSLETAAEQR